MFLAIIMQDQDQDISSVRERTGTMNEDCCCPQCGVTFSSCNFRQLNETCGHVICGQCLAVSQSKNTNGCSQCQCKTSARNDDPNTKNGDTRLGPGKMTTDFVNVQLKESPTIFTITIPSQSVIIGGQCNPIRVNSANTFVFNSDDNPVEPVSCIPFPSQSGLPTGAGPLEASPNIILPPGYQECETHRVNQLENDVMRSFITSASYSPPAELSVPVDDQLQLSLPVIPFGAENFFTVFSDDPLAPDPTPVVPYQCSSGEEARRKGATLSFVQPRQQIPPVNVNMEVEAESRSFLSSSSMSSNEEGWTVNGDCTTQNQDHLQKPFTCSTCNRHFFNCEGFIAHMGQMHNEKSPLLCSFCNQGYGNPSNLKRHMFGHLDLWPFKCSICENTFKSKHGVVFHLKTQHGQAKNVAAKMASESGRKFLKGIIMDGSVDSIPDSKIHSVIIDTALRIYNLYPSAGNLVISDDEDVNMETNKGTPMTPDATSSFPILRSQLEQDPSSSGNFVQRFPIPELRIALQCSYCNKSCVSNSDLRRHLINHSDQTPYKCTLCGSAFKRKYNLITHIMAVHNEPKAVAVKLTDHAGLDYLKESLEDPLSLRYLSPSRIHQLVTSTVLKKSNLTVPDPDGVATNVDPMINEQNNVLDDDPHSNSNAAPMEELYIIP